MKNQKKVWAVMLLWVFIIWNIWTTFAKVAVWAWMFGLSTSGFMQVRNILHNHGIKDSKFGDIMSTVRTLVTTAKSQNLSAVSLLNTSLNVVSWANIKTINKTLKATVDIVSPDKKISKLKDLSTKKTILLINQLKTLKNVNSAELSWLVSRVILTSNVINNGTTAAKKIGQESVEKILENFGKFDPSSPVTFNDIKVQWIKNLKVDAGLLNCSLSKSTNCTILSGLVNRLLSVKHLTIDDIYRLGIYHNYLMTHLWKHAVTAPLKKWDIVIWFDKNTSTVTSLDLVRSVSTVDSGMDNVLTVKSPWVVTIKIVNKLQNFTGTEPRIVLWLNEWTVVGVGVYPTEKTMNMPLATSFKVMTISWLKVCKKNHPGIESFWLGNWKLWLSHWWINLTPKWTKWIEFNLKYQCYTTFNN